MIVDEYGGKTMTVGELIIALQKMPNAAPVVTEGCDCDGDAFRVVHRPDSGDVYIERYHTRRDPEHEDYEGEE